MPDTAVKEEVDEPQIPSDPVDVPPGVVLDKLEGLVTSGKVLLRFAKPAAKSWGMIGKVSNQWCSFKTDPDGTCQFVDDTVWATEAAGEWAESELEWLEKIRQAALKVPATQAAQPTALRPRECRRASFAYHKAEYAKQRNAKAKAKAKAKASATSPVAPTASPAKAKLSPTSKAITATTKVHSTGSPSSSPAAGTQVAKTPPASGPAAGKPGAEGTRTAAFAGFLSAVKARLTQTGQREKYREFLAAVAKGAQEQAILAALSGHDDLVEQFRGIPRPGAPGKAPAAKPPGAPPPKAGKGPPPAAAESQAEAAAAAAPEPEEPPPKPPVVALPRLLQPPVDVEKEVLAPLRKCGGDAAAQLVRLVLSKRQARAGLRLSMLKYARSQSMEEGAFREMIILRGPPGMGKSAWAMEQLRLQVGLAEDEELVARLTHVCSANDFFRTFKANDQEDYAFDPEQIEMAHARNEARVRVATEAGIHPLYIDNPHIQLWEMGAYVRLAQQAGYEVSVVAPQDIFFGWSSSDALIERASEKPGGQEAVSQELLEEVLKVFEAMPEGEDPVQVLLKAQRPATQSPAAAGAKRPVPSSSPGPPAKVAKVIAKVPQQPAKPPPGNLVTPKVAKQPGTPPPAGGSTPPRPASAGTGALSAEARAAASLLSGMRKKAS